MKDFPFENQRMIYDDIKNKLISQLETILIKSTTASSINALFFMLYIATFKKEEDITKIAETFYEKLEHRMIKMFFINLNKLLRGNDTQSMAIKSITDPRFFPQDPSYSCTAEEIASLCSIKLTVDIQKWFFEKSEDKIFKQKDIFILDKHYYQDEIINENNLT